MACNLYANFWLYCRKRREIPSSPMMMEWKRGSKFSSRESDSIAVQWLVILPLDLLGILYPPVCNPLLSRVNHPVIILQRFYYRLLMQIEQVQIFNHRLHLLWEREFPSTIHLHQTMKKKFIEDVDAKITPNSQVKIHHADGASRWRGGGEDKINAAQRIPFNLFYGPRSEASLLLLARLFTCTIRQ